MWLLSWFPLMGQLIPDKSVTILKWELFLPWMGPELSAVHKLTEATFTVKKSHTHLNDLVLSDKSATKSTELLIRRLENPTKGEKHGAEIINEVHWFRKEYSASLEDFGSWLCWRSDHLFYSVELFWSLALRPDDVLWLRSMKSSDKVSGSYMALLKRPIKSPCSTQPTSQAGIGIISACGWRQMKFACFFLLLRAFTLGKLANRT